MTFNEKATANNLENEANVVDALRGGPETRDDTPIVEEMREAVEHADSPPQVPEI